MALAPSEKRFTYFRGGELRHLGFYSCHSQESQWSCRHYISILYVLVCNCTALYRSLRRDMSLPKDVTNQSLKASLLSQRKKKKSCTTPLLCGTKNLNHVIRSEPASGGWDGGVRVLASTATNSSRVVGNRGDLMSHIMSIDDNILL